MRPPAPAVTIVFGEKCETLTADAFSELPDKLRAALGAVQPASPLRPVASYNWPETEDAAARWEDFLEVLLPYLRSAPYYALPDAATRAQMARWHSIADIDGGGEMAHTQLLATTANRASRDPREALAWFGVAQEAVAQLRTAREMYEELAGITSSMMAAFEAAVAGVTATIAGATAPAKRKHADM
jgi:hypothetical protein